MSLKVTGDIIPALAAKESITATADVHPQLLPMLLMKIAGGDGKSMAQPRGFTPPPSASVNEPLH